MNNGMAINEFRDRIRIDKYAFAQDSNGGNVKSIIEQYYLWAKVENMIGSRILSNLQITYSKAFKVTTRYEVNRPLFPIDEIGLDDGLTYTIQSVTQLEQGRRNFNVMIAYTNDSESNTGDALIINTDQNEIMLTVTAGEDLPAFRVVYLDNGTAYLYDPSDTTMPNYALGITKSGVTSNHNVLVQTEGIFDDNGLGLTSDNTYYSGANGALVTDITGLTVIQEVGKTITATRLDINFNSPIIIS